ncbi:hypothetical protein HPB51_010796 [Rhipicephalus microplus]|uniref:Uncharacterized protein n=1 Tax=Rhipicephalus microplus TaxID=6941 RepID=A0A9J6DVH3_RHIMP|nr:hypothetical protein HPB51_010796 [Rhipicephalus microplus]
MDINRRRYREASLRTFEPFLKEYDSLLRYILTEVQHFKDKNITSKMLQTALQEIERLEGQLEVKTDCENKYVETFRELEKTKSELFEAQKNLHTTKLRMARYSEPVYVIENQLQEKEKKLDEVLQHLQQTQEKLILAEEERTEAISRLAAVEAHLTKSCMESANNSQELKAYRNRSKALQEQLSSALEHAEESVNMTERALLEKQEAQLRSDLLENEVMELRTSLEAVVEEAAQHTANEVMNAYCVKLEAYKFVRLASLEL